MESLNPLATVLRSGANAVEKVAGVFTSNSEADAQRAADEQMALLQAYEAEFQARDQRTAVDAFADAFNRLVRPFIVSIVVFIFVVAYISPAHFAQITLALSSIPNGYWALLSVIIGFYFGGRMQLKSQNFAFRKTQADAVRRLIEARKEFRNLAMDDDEPDRLVGDSLAKAAPVAEARKGRINAVVSLWQATPEEERSARLAEQIDQLRAEDVEQARARQQGGPRAKGR